MHRSLVIQSGEGYKRRIEIPLGIAGVLLDSQLTASGHFNRCRDEDVLMKAPLDSFFNKSGAESVTAISQWFS